MVADRSGRRPTWWPGATGYEVYLRSFADSDGDGVGDLPGLTGRLHHLAELGVDFLWVTPFYGSPMADWGYDVADHCSVDPTFGTLDDFDELVERAHALDLHVVVDLVPNHTSDQHPWFLSARADPEGDHRDRYIWRDPAPDGGPPNNWISHFGGSAWTLDEASGQYHLHLFLPEQPDLNWRHPAVVEEFDRILRFWLERGVDGFRIDMAGTLFKDRDLRSNPQVADWDPAQPIWEQWQAFEHRHDVLQPESLDIFRRWRSIVDDHDGYLMGETFELDPHGMARLLPGDGLHGGFWFAPMHIRWRADAIRRVLVEPTALLGDRLVWATGSHDIARAPTRLGADDAGRQRTLALNVLLAGLPGVLVLYQGEELGLVDGDVPEGAGLDPVGATDGAAGRDGCRTPMPWSQGPANGFTTGAPWLRSAERQLEETAAHQVGRRDSWFGHYQRLLAVRRQVPDEPVHWVDGGEGPVVAYRRGLMHVAANTSDEASAIEVDADVTLEFATPGVALGEQALLLPPRAAAIWRTTGDEPA